MISQCLQVVLMSWAPAINDLIVRCRQLLPSIILQKVLEFADVLPNSRIVSCDEKQRLWLKKVGMAEPS